MGHFLEYIFICVVIGSIPGVLQGFSYCDMLQDLCSSSYLFLLLDEMPAEYLGGDVVSPTNLGYWPVWHG